MLLWSKSLSEVLRRIEGDAMIRELVYEKNLID